MHPTFRSDEIRRLRFAHEAWSREFEALKSVIARSGGGYNSDQPRVPAGSPEGGQWTDGGGFDGASIHPARGLSGLPSRARTTIQSALALFTALSARNRSSSRAIIRFHREYLPDEKGHFRVDQPVVLTEGQVAEACPQLGTIQEETDHATDTVDKTHGDLPPATRGTYIHKALSDQIKLFGDPNLIAEESYTKSEEARIYYGMPGTIRIDVLEKVRDGTVCVYDIKTGYSGLSINRAGEIVRAVAKHFPSTSRFIVTDVRPRRDR